MKLFSKIAYHSTKQKGLTQFNPTTNENNAYTGEGAMVHGWGLYLQEDKQLNIDNYKDKLSLSSQYAVEIPDDMIFAEEDETLHNQPEVVRKAFESLGVNETFSYKAYSLPSYSKNSISTIIAKHTKNERCIVESETIRHVINEWYDNYDDDICSVSLGKQIDFIFKANCGVDIDAESLRELTESILKYISNYETEKKSHINFYNAFIQVVAKYGDQGASEKLSSLGVDGIHYNGNADGSCWVIFNCSKLKIVSEE